MFAFLRNAAGHIRLPTGPSPEVYRVGNALIQRIGQPGWLLALGDEVLAGRLTLDEACARAVSQAPDHSTVAYDAVVCSQTAIAAVTDGPAGRQRPRVLSSLAAAAVQPLLDRKVGGPDGRLATGPPVDLDSLLNAAMATAPAEAQASAAVAL